MRSFALVGFGLLGVALQSCSSSGSTVESSGGSGGAATTGAGGGSNTSGAGGSGGVSRSSGGSGNSTSASGGVSSSSGGAVGKGGNAASSSGGRSAAGGSTGKAGAGTGGASDGGASGKASGCGNEVAVNETPFGCKFAWGANGNTGNRSSYLNFITTWVGYETNGGLNNACDGCGLARTLASGSAIATYYAYFIGYQANKLGGFGDCNTDKDGRNLCTDGAQWIKSNRAMVIDMYANYAKMTHQASPNKPVAWLLEGDFIQYTNSSQSSPLSMQEIGQLTSDIVCAIKSNEPNALVAVNHSSWIRNPQLTSYFNALPLSIVDFVWTTGMGNVAGGYLNNGDANNRMDGTYAYLHELTGKKLFVDTSFGASQQNDSWSNTPVATLNQRITDGVVAANVTEPPSDYQSRVQSLSPQLDSVCP
jgi:hypothetical protein